MEIDAELSCCEILLDVNLAENSFPVKEKNIENSATLNK